MVTLLLVWKLNFRVHNFYLDKFEVILASYKVLVEFSIGDAFSDTDMQYA